MISQKPLLLKQCQENTDFVSRRLGGIFGLIFKANEYDWKRAYFYATSN